MKFIILPHQLYEISIIRDKLPKSVNILDIDFILWEHPTYFTSYKFNKKKLLLHRASLKYYNDYLKDNGIKSVLYIEYHTKYILSGEYYIFDPIDKLILDGTPILLESPNFLLTKQQYETYRNKTSSFIFNNFYMWSKKLLNIIPNIKSLDKLNRGKLQPDVIIPKTPGLSSKDTIYINNAKKYINIHFPNNYGNTDNFIYPITHSTAKKWFKYFLIKKLKNFGKYQDAIVEGESVLFHSMLSSSINIGIINPNYIISELKKIEIQQSILPSLEGYIRQLFWREYQRYCYIHYNFKGKNYIGNTKKLNSKWYSGSIGIKPVDECIKKGFDTGYLHHIERLMIIGNFMNLYGIHPYEGFKWFMEFSIDSYEWVMCQNVLDMVFFVSGGITMRKPYISSSNYILNQSNYKKEEWCTQWDTYYNSYLKKHKAKLWKFRYYFPSLIKM